MSPMTLRRRLTLLVSVLLALAVAVPTFALSRAKTDRAEERLSARVSSAVRDVDLVISETPRGTIDLSAYEQTPRVAGAPFTAVLAPAGTLLAGDREIPATVRQEARRLSAASEDGPTVVGQGSGAVRVAAVRLEGEQRALGIAVAYQDERGLRSEVRDDELLLLALALVGWALGVGLVAALLERSLAPSRDAARRERAFLADAAHELRTPWAIVRGRAEQGLRDGPREEDLAFVAATAGAAAEAIGDMLELARLDAGQAVGERVPIALDALVDASLSEREAVAEAAGVRIVRGLDDRVVAAADEGLLTRAVGNLLDNALRHGAAGGLLEVSVIADGSDAVIEVNDRGVGIPPGQRERIFDRFHRGASATPGGAGLGLPIAALVAQAHGGSLTLAPADPERPGARFVLRVPRA